MSWAAKARRVAVAETAAEAKVPAATASGSGDCVFGNSKEEEGAHPRVGEKILLEDNIK